MSPRILLSTLFTSASALLCATAQSQVTHIDLTYPSNSGTKTCTFVSNDPNGVTLVTSGPNAGHLATTTTVAEAQAFTGQCPSGGPPPDPLITVSSLQPSTTQPVVNTAFSVGFSTTNSPDYCTGEGSSNGITGWPSNTTHICDAGNCASASIPVTATTVGSATFVAKCYKNGQSAVSSAPLALSVSDVLPTVCDGVTPVVANRMGTTAMTYIRSGGNYFRTGNFQNYMDIIGVIPPTSGQAAPTFAAWPGNVNNQQIFWTMAPNSFGALQFTVPASASSTLVYDFQFIQTGFLPHDKLASMSISRCPGDFRSSLPAICKTEWDGNDGGVLAMAPDHSPFSSSFVCKVTRGETYYLNFVGGTLAAPSTPTCPSGTCNLGIKVKLQQARPSE